MTSFDVNQSFCGIELFLLEGKEKRLEGNVFY
jgi:hypothetical protein